MNKIFRSIKLNIIYFIRIIVTQNIQFPALTYQLQMQKGITSSSSYNAKNVDEYHASCVCQICTCHKHKCPHSKIHIPFEEISSYQKQYVPHPLGFGSKHFPEKSQYQSRPYGNINSAYRQDYPGHKPQLRQKLVPRVKDQDKKIPFQGQSWYKTTYVPKKGSRDPVRIKDKDFNPCTQPFYGSTTYNSDFIPKRANTHAKNPKQKVEFPQGYKFSGQTTYNNDFIQKPIQPARNCKPVEKAGSKGSHDLNTIYRNDFTQKKPLHTCPVNVLPNYPREIPYPKQHVVYDKYSNEWKQK